LSQSIDIVNTQHALNQVMDFEIVALVEDILNEVKGEELRNAKPVIQVDQSLCEEAPISKEIE
jgi:hypothetical protein